MHPDGNVVASKKKAGKLEKIWSIEEDPNSPGVGYLGSAEAFYPARDLFSFFNDRYAAINHRNDSLLIFWSSPSIRPK